MIVPAHGSAAKREAIVRAATTLFRASAADHRDNLRALVAMLLGCASAR